MVKQASQFSRSAEVTAKSKQVEAAAQAHTDAEEATAVLEGKPDDPEANLMVGKYLCFTKGDWEKGLPLLTKSENSRLKLLAERDVRCCRPRTQRPKNK